MRHLLISLLCLTLFACSKTETANLLPNETEITNRDGVLPQVTIEGVWFHSFEEDNNGQQLYRPAEFDFPPTRVRSSFVFKGKGLVDYVTILPNDAPLVVSGTWKQDNGFIEVTLSDKIGTKAYFSMDEFHKGILIKLANG